MSARDKSEGEALASPDRALFEPAAELAGFESLWDNADDVGDDKARDRYS